MPFELPDLPYAYNALEPFLSDETLHLHHDKHHAAYVNGLNEAEEKLAKAQESGDFAAIRALLQRHGVQLLGPPAAHAVLDTT